MAQNTKSTGFQQGTIENVINPLRSILASKSGQTYKSLGTFYREIEVLKFPFMKAFPKGSRFNPNHGRNAYSQQQYDSIKDLMIAEGRISIIPNPKRNGYYIVLVH